jgi:hypothetical protein
MPAACWAAERAKAGARGAECGPQRCKAQIRCATAAHGTAITEPHPRFRRSYRKSGYEPDPRGPGVSETFADIYRFTIRFARQEF